MSGIFRRGVKKEIANDQRQIQFSTKAHSELARRAAMLQEAADAFPPCRDRDRLLLQVFALEERLRSLTLRPAAIQVPVQVDNASVRSRQG